MLYKTRGIVLNYIKYKESSIIVKIYTEQFGLQTYIENGVRSAKSKGKIALFQPLTLVDLVAYHKVGIDIQRISEIKCHTPFFSIPTDIKKSAIGIFVAEILSMVLKEQSENSLMFEFVNDALIFLEDNTHQIENFHLYFLSSLSAYLGFGAENAKEFSRQMQESGFVLNKEEEVLMEKIMTSPFGEPLYITKVQRLRALDILLDIYKINLDHFTGAKSIPILKEVLE